MIGTVILAARLCASIAEVYPDVPLERACSAAVAITLAADGEDPLLLAAVAYRESRFVATARNPRTGCGGPMQVRGFHGGEVAGYRAGVRVLREGRAWCARRGTPTTLCELAAFASGPRGPREALYRGPWRVLAGRAALVRAIGARPGVAPAIGAAS